MADTTNKTAMFIDYQTQSGETEFSFNRMDITDVQLFYDALLLLIDQDYKSDPKKYHLSIQLEKYDKKVTRLLTLKKEFEVNHYTQNKRVPLITPWDLDRFETMTKG